jgi:hypothetical protein
MDEFLNHFHDPEWKSYILEHAHFIDDICDKKTMTSAVESSKWKHNLPECGICHLLAVASCIHSSDKDQAAHKSSSHQSIGTKM